MKNNFKKIGEIVEVYIRDKVCLVDYKMHALGRYKKIEDAIAARKKAELKLVPELCKTEKI